MVPRFTRPLTVYERETGKSSAITPRVRAVSIFRDASFDALEAGGTVEGLFDFVLRALVRCFVWNFFCFLRSSPGALSLVLFLLPTHPLACPQFLILGLGHSVI